MRVVMDNQDSHEGEYCGITSQCICVDVGHGTFVLLPEAKIAHIELEKHELSTFGVHQ